MSVSVGRVGCMTMSMFWRIYGLYRQPWCTLCDSMAHAIGGGRGRSERELSDRAYSQVRDAVAVGRRRGRALLKLVACALGDGRACEGAVRARPCFARNTRRALAVCCRCGRPRLSEAWHTRAPWCALRIAFTALELPSGACLTRAVCGSRSDRLDSKARAAWAADSHATVAAVHR